MKRLTAFLTILALLFCTLSFASADGEAWTCPACGTEGNTGNFCPNCATPRPQAVVCPGCGAEYGADTTFAFCPNCGAALKANDAAPEVPAAEEPVPEEPVPPAPAPEEPTPEEPQAPEEPVPEEPQEPETPARRDLVQVSDGTYLLDQVLTHESFSEIWLTDGNIDWDLRSGKAGTYAYLVFSPSDTAYISEISDNKWSTHDPDNKIQVHYSLLKDGKFKHWFNDCRDMGNVNGSRRYMNVSEHEVYLVFKFKAAYVNPQYRLVVKIVPELPKDAPVGDVMDALNAAADAENERILATVRKETRGPLWTTELFSGADLLGTRYYEFIRTRFDFSPISLEAVQPGLETSGFTMDKLAYNGVEGYYITNRNNAVELKLYHSEREDHVPSLKKGKTGASFNYTTAAGNTYECFAEDHKDGGYRNIYLSRKVNQTKSGAEYMEIWIIAPYETYIQSKENVQAVIEELDAHITVTR